MNITMSLVEMMKFPIHKIIGVISMRNGGMTTSRSVLMRSTSSCLLSTFGRVGITDLNHMFINVISMGTVKMSVMKKSGMPIVDNLNMSASLSMFVRTMSLMLGTFLVNFSVVIAVSIVNMVKMSIHKVIMVIVVGDRGMTT